MTFCALSSAKGMDIKMRKKKAMINIIFSLLLQVVTVISGFIVPRLFIGKFGSEVNGLVNSIASFVGYITLLQSGVGSVVKASLYKPLAHKDKKQLCVIAKTADVFFNKIAIATLIYLGLLSFVFPTFIAKDFSWIYTATLVVIVGASTAAQYFFGITYQMILEADQRSYVYSIIQIITVVINTILVVILIKLNCSVQIVKGVSAMIYVARPIVIGTYTKKSYSITKDIESDDSLIKQRWDGFIQAIALFIHQKTDIFVLTIFTTFTDVSIYSVYVMVTSGLSSLLDAIDKAVRAAFGNIIACDEKHTLINTFNAYNTLIHMLSTICFSTAMISIFNFISIYVGDVSDTNYIRPLFGILIISAEFIYCLRMPYNSIIYAAGKFKETKMPAGIEAGLNIVISCCLVPFLGLPGVAIGTLVAMLYRCFSFALYLTKDILFIKISSQVKRFVITFITYAVNILLISRVKVTSHNYAEWIFYAGAVCVLSSIITFVINYALDKKGTIGAIKMLVRK